MENLVLGRKEGGVHLKQCNRGTSVDRASTGGESGFGTGGGSQHQTRGGGSLE